MKLKTAIIVKETNGISRLQEPVTVGIPVPQGKLTDGSTLVLKDKNQTLIPLQFSPLARWSDGSIKWVLLDFQTTVDAVKEEEFILEVTEETPSLTHSVVTVDENDGQILVNTGVACFHISTDTFGPFSQVIVGGEDFLEGKKSTTILTDSSSKENLPVISSWEWENSGPIRSTLKISGVFQNQEGEELLSFCARLTFYAGLSGCKIDFTLWNPQAAEHEGGLWDLGDAGSVYFKDLSTHLFPAFTQSPSVSWKESTDSHRYEGTGSFDLQIYQDSSGGENWQSKNHVNKDNEVKTSFRGYVVTSNGENIKDGLRAEPVVIVANDNKHISFGIREFWQNFPKALETTNDKLTARFFPHQFDDVFELQGGERKTHSLFLDFNNGGQKRGFAGWLHKPLEVRATPEWYAETRAIPYLTPVGQDPDEQLRNLIQPAIEGENTFFGRREIIDEYGWRNFGDWYADHEAVGYEGELPLVAHYNNQYDGILGTLHQYLKSGDCRWYQLGDQLARHVKDIDLYHTEHDKPEFNKGLLWHTEHYLTAETVTHRCFSKRHAGFRNLDSYGGGPAMSHNYAGGLLLHYYLTGDSDSKESVLDLAEFIQSIIRSRTTLTYFLVENLRKTRTALKNRLKGRAMVDFDKVYSMNGPGRGAGNSITTLLTAYELTGDEQYLQSAEDVIKICIHPDDDIEKMDMLDIENRWMYTVFLQALGKYLDITSGDAKAQLWEYSRDSLLHYVRWMLENEYLYLDKPDKLEYPNETWAAQEIRKCNVLLYATQYSDQTEQQVFFEKASFFYNGCLNQLSSYETCKLTRPITVLLQNCLMMTCCQAKFKSMPTAAPVAGGLKESAGGIVGKRVYGRMLIYILRKFSLKDELEFIRSRLK